MKINNFLKFLAGSAIALALSPNISVEAATTQYDSLFVFGDSLSDTGNNFALSQSLIPPEPFYSQGRLTNGLNWVDYLSQDLGLNLTNYAKLNPNSSIPSDGINFAFGGAKTGAGNLGSPPFPFLGVEQQIDAYQNLLGDKTAKSDSLHLIMAGGNDYIGGMTNPQEPVSNLVNAVTELASVGARDIVVFNMPDLGKTPLGISQGPLVSSQLSTLSQVHNALLAKSLAGLSEQLPQSNIISFDLYGLFKNIQSNPAAFGYKNVTDNCTGISFPNVSQANIPDWQACSAALAQDPKAFLFYDDQHPTTTTNALLADSVRQKVSGSVEGGGGVAVPEPKTATALIVLGLGWFKKLIRDRALSQKS
jgi:phospholipase/lecithinase/hemolysin